MLDNATPFCPIAVELESWTKSGREMAINWSNLRTRHPSTGAMRTLGPELLAASFLAPVAEEPDWDGALARDDAPWARSFEAVPDQVRLSIEQAFGDLAEATRTARLESIDISDLPSGRARRHVEALLELEQELKGVPADLAAIRHVLDSSEALEPFPVCPPPRGTFDSVLECALHERFLNLFGEADPGPTRETRATIGRALRGIQDNLLKLAEPAEPDDSIRFFAVRDASSEADLAAALARRLLDEGSTPQDIAVLMPNSSYPGFVATAFEKACIPLAGVPADLERDAEGETLRLLLQAMHPSPPPMVWASLCISPLMPWTAREGAKMAREVMRSGSTGTVPEFLLRAKGPVPGNRKALMARFSGLKLKDNVPALAKSTGRLASAAPSSEDASLDMAATLRALRPSSPPRKAAERMVEAASLWKGDEEPWRPARHLIVLGFAGDGYPAGTGVGPLFLDSELALLKLHCGLGIPTRAERMRRNLDRFRRQLGMVSETATFLIPKRDFAGGELGSCPGFALVARAISGGNGKGPHLAMLDGAPDELWPCSARIRMPMAGTCPILPENGMLDVGQNALHLRKDEDGKPKPQSPSRLETMLVSPLVWAMREAGAEPVEWLPPGMDAMSQGSLYHAVLENLFPEGATPSELELREAFDDAFDRAVDKTARLLREDIWKVEAASFRSEALRMALSWRSRLDALGANVLASEQRLEGTALGLGMNGIADALIGLPGGRMMVVDFKASKSDGRRKRMEKGWDLQVALYRLMIEDAGNEETRRIAEGGEDVDIAYHLLRDGVTLATGRATDSGELERVGSDISGEALKRLGRTLSELEKGIIRLNGRNDALEYEKESGFKPYALVEDSLAMALCVDAAGE